MIQRSKKPSGGGDGMGSLFYLANARDVGEWAVAQILAPENTRPLET